MLYFILVNYEERQLKMIENNEDNYYINTLQKCRVFFRS